MKTWLALSGLMFVLPALVHAQEQGDVSHGQTYAAQVCAECHAIGRDSEPSPNLSAAPFADITMRPEMTSMALSVWLQSEHESMPHIVPKAEELNDLLAYMMSLKKIKE